MTAWTRATFRPGTTSRSSSRSRGELENGIKIGGRIELEGAFPKAASPGGWRPDDELARSSRAPGAWSRPATCNPGATVQTWAGAGPERGLRRELGRTRTSGSTIGGTGSQGGERLSVPEASRLGQHGHRRTTIRPSPTTRRASTASSSPDPIATGHRRWGSGYGRMWRDEDTEYSNAVDGSIHYAGDVGGIGLGVMLGAAGATAPNMRGANAAATTTRP